MKWTNDRADNVDDRRGSGGGGGMLVGGGLGTLIIAPLFFSWVVIRLLSSAVV